MKKIGIISVFCVFFDQLIKVVVTKNLVLNKSVTLINDFFYLTLVRNDGAAWSILSGNRLFLILIALFTIILIYLFCIKNKSLNYYLTITYGLLLGGIIGNLIDRIIFGYVIDYLDFYILNYNFPIFNLADIFIVLSVFLIIIDTFRGDKNEIKSND